MIAAIATIAFLAAAWAAIVAIAGSVDVDFDKVGAALRGHTQYPAPMPVAGRISQRYPTARSQRVRAQTSLRAVA